MRFFQVEGILAGFSTVASALIVITYLVVKDLRRHPTNLVFWLAVADLFFSLKFVITALAYDSQNKQNLPDWCLAQALAAQFWGIASISWNGMISVNLLIKMYNPFVDTRFMSKWFHLWTWSLSIITTAIMMSGSNPKNDPNNQAAWRYGPAGDGTCWVVNNWRLLFFVPLAFYSFIAIITVVLAAVRAKSIQRQLDQAIVPDRDIEHTTHRNARTPLISKPHSHHQHEHQKKDSGRFMPQSSTEASLANQQYYKLLIRMSLYVFTFLLLWSLPLAHRIQQIIKPELENNYQEATVIQYLDIIGVALQGFCNALVWITNPPIWRSFKKKVLPAPIAHIIRVTGGADSSSTDGEGGSGEFRKNPHERQADVQNVDVLLRKYVISCIISGITKSVTRLIESGDSQRSIVTSDFTDVQEIQEDESMVSRVTNHTFFVDYAPLVFMNLRRIAGVSNKDYLSAMEPRHFMANLKNQKFSDGRSGSFFVFSPDKKYILKTLTQYEAQLLIDILPEFYRHMNSHPGTLINRFYGLHAFNVSHGQTTIVAVMENVIDTSRIIDRTYDLKGSWVNRRVGKPHDENGKQGMDVDFAGTKRKLKMNPRMRELFLRQIEIDSKFFASQNIMDYSLLLGFHKIRDNEEFINDDQSDEKPFFRLADGGILSEDGTEIYFVGVIDILQAWDAAKKRERFFKVYVLQKDKWGISAQHPRFYSERFIKGMRGIVEGGSLSVSRE